MAGQRTTALLLLLLVLTCGPTLVEAQYTPCEPLGKLPCCYGTSLFRRELNPYHQLSVTGGCSYQAGPALSLDSRQLQSLAPGVFRNMPASLLLLNLRLNLLRLRAHEFSALRRLEKLLLNGNGLTDLPLDVFTGLEILQELELQDNELTELRLGVFAPLERLEVLQLQDNKLTQLPMDLFTPLRGLKKLSLAGNALVCVPMRQAQFDALNVVQPGFPCYGGPCYEGPPRCPCPDTTEFDYAEAEANGNAICRCKAGYTGPDGGPCTECPGDTYKETMGSAPCSICPKESQSPAASARSTDCICKADTFKDTRFEAATEGDFTCSKCPENSESLAASNYVTDCKCKAGHEGADGGTCIVCPAGRYKATIGSSVCLECSGNLTSPSGSVSATDCVEPQASSSASPVRIVFSVKLPLKEAEFTPDKQLLFRAAVAATAAVSMDDVTILSIIEKQERRAIALFITTEVRAKDEAAGSNIASSLEDMEDLNSKLDAAGLPATLGSAPEVQQSSFSLELILIISALITVCFFLLICHMCKRRNRKEHSQEMEVLVPDTARSSANSDVEISDPSGGRGAGETASLAVIDDEKYWDDLDEDEKRHWQALGWSSESWNGEVPAPVSHSCPRYLLSATQREAAQALQLSWAVHCPCDGEGTTEDKTDCPKREAVLPKPNRLDTDDSGSDIELGELDFNGFISGKAQQSDKLPPPLYTKDEMARRLKKAKGAELERQKREQEQREIEQHAQAEVSRPELMQDLLLFEEVVSKKADSVNTSETNMPTPSADPLFSPPGACRSDQVKQTEEDVQVVSARGGGGMGASDTKQRHPTVEEEPEEKDSVIESSRFLNPDGPRPLEVSESRAPSSLNRPQSAAARRVKIRHSTPLIPSRLTKDDGTGSSAELSSPNTPPLSPAQTGKRLARERGRRKAQERLGAATASEDGADAGTVEGSNEGMEVRRRAKLPPLRAYDGNAAARLRASAVKATAVAAGDSGPAEDLDLKESQSEDTRWCVRHRALSSSLSELIKYHVLVKSIKPLDERKEAKGKDTFVLCD